MPDVVKHAWTHRPRSMGGTDPIPLDLPWAYGKVDGGQSVTTDAKLRLDVFTTNAPGVFALDTSDDSGILIRERGFFLAAGTLENGATSANVYTDIQPESVTQPSGNEFGWGSFSGAFAFDTSLLDPTQSRQNHIAMGRVFGTRDVPWRAVLSCVGTFTITEGSLVVVKIGGLPS